MKRNNNNQINKYITDLPHKVVRLGLEDRHPYSAVGARVGGEGV